MASASSSSSSSSGLVMDNETALNLVKNGSTLLLLDVPQHTLFGIDTQMFSVGPIFKGMKMIPPGPHFIYYSPANKEGNEFSPMIGFFLTTTASEVVVRKWDQQEERLIGVSEDEENRYSEAVKRFEFDHQLGPYALEYYGGWKQLSNYISRSIIERIEPMGGEISVAYESGFIENAPKTAMEKRLMEQLKANLYCKVQTREKHSCYYTAIPPAVKLKGISGEELTAMNLDKTKLLETILMRDYGGAEDSLLGEIQFAFVAFMMGQSLEAFYQWKALVSLLLGCEEAPLRSRTQLFSKFVRIIFYQLKHGFDSKQMYQNSGRKDISLFLDDAWFSKEIFLYHLCKDFFPLVLESTVIDGDLLLWTRKLKKLLECTLGWDFEGNTLDLLCEDDEFSPVVVSMDEEC